MSPSSRIDYVSTETAEVFGSATGDDDFMELLWGDRVQVLEEASRRVKVRARGRKKIGWVDRSALGGKPLLELYFIDVGQGDGVLIKTPKGRHLMIDGGYRRRSQDTGKSAADFVDWKFREDYNVATIKLDAMLATHCDADHYGGLTDLLDEISDPDKKELKCKEVRVKAFYHAGVGYWRDKPRGKRWLGPEKKVDGKSFLTRLMGNRKEVEKALADGAKPELQGQWRELMEAVAATEWTDGTPTEIKRLSDRDEYVPGFGPEVEGEPAIKILAPVESKVGGKSAVRSFKKESLSTNGNSLLLSVKLGSCRILLTGDLNKASQHALLEDYKGRRKEFLCDVAKACHHGSGDVAFSFLQAMSPAVTVFSSGDNEGHDHPKPSIIAASAIAGHVTQNDETDELVTPLIYSTELARSVRLGDPNKLTYELPPDPASKAKTKRKKKATLEGETFEQGTVAYTETKPGALSAEKGTRPVERTRIVSGLIYGLVNVRTDGDKILCATLDEKDYAWRVETTQSRF